MVNCDHVEGARPDPLAGAWSARAFRLQFDLRYLAYLRWVTSLQRTGFEIVLHNNTSHALRHSRTKGL
jgi:hypothetical protein